jgi:hypothetical protein
MSVRLLFAHSSRTLFSREEKYIADVVKAVVVDGHGRDLGKKKVCGGRAATTKKKKNQGGVEGK